MCFYCAVEEAIEKWCNRPVLVRQGYYLPAPIRLLAVLRFDLNLRRYLQCRN